MVLIVTVAVTCHGFHASAWRSAATVIVFVPIPPEAVSSRRVHQCPAQQPQQPTLHHRRGRLGVPLRLDLPCLVSTRDVRALCLDGQALAANKGPVIHVNVDLGLVTDLARHHDHVGHLTGLGPCALAQTARRAEKTRNHQDGPRGG